jgi:cephalosporin-C deacetylase-like acetyl esterase
MKRGILFSAAGLAVIFITGALSAKTVKNNLTDVYSYDKNSPLELKQAENNDYSDSDVTVYTIIYRGTPVRKVIALLVTPNKKGNYSGIIFMHWLGGSSDNTEFINEAVTLAKNGVVSILPNGYLPFFEAMKGKESDTNLVINQIIEIRRALDILLMQPGVDPLRIGFIGHDYGAMHGTVLSGVESRVKAYVFMTPTSHYWDWGALSYLSANRSSSTDMTENQVFRKLMLPYDPISYLSYAAPSSILFQFSKQDNFVSESTALELYNAASSPKEIRWYDSGHSLDSEAKMYRDQWILEKLGSSGK